MTNQEINQAIAEYLGWKWKPKGDKYGPLVHPWIDPTGRCIPELPNFCNDLNACREMEGHLTPQQFDAYYDLLSSWASEATTVKDGIWLYRKRLISAKARQRAEAFLRTVGKWKK